MLDTWEILNQTTLAEGEVGQRTDETRSLFTMAARSSGVRSPCCPPFLILSLYEGGPVLNRAGTLTLVVLRAVCFGLRRLAIQLLVSDS